MPAHKYYIVPVIISLSTYLHTKIHQFLTTIKIRDLGRSFYWMAPHLLPTFATIFRPFNHDTLNTFSICIFCSNPAHILLRNRKVLLLFKKEIGTGVTDFLRKYKVFTSVVTFLFTFLKISKNQTTNIFKICRRKFSRRATTAQACLFLFIPKFGLIHPCCWPLPSSPRLIKPLKFLVLNVHIFFRTCYVRLYKAKNVLYFAIRCLRRPTVQDPECRWYDFIKNFSSISKFNQITELTKKKFKY